MCLGDSSIIDLNYRNIVYNLNVLLCQVLKTALKKKLGGCS